MTWPTTITAIGVLFGQLHQTQGALADLAHAAGGPLKLFDSGCLNGVDDQGHWMRRPRQVHDAPDFTLGHDRDPLAGRVHRAAQPAGPQPGPGRPSSPVA